MSMERWWGVSVLGGAVDSSNLLIARMRTSNIGISRPLDVQMVVVEVLLNTVVLFWVLRCDCVYGYDHVSCYFLYCLLLFALHIVTFKPTESVESPEHLHRPMHCT
jgi:hypothetical protein